jgi:transcriptional regulator with XRE-family HTH domain
MSDLTPSAAFGKRLREVRERARPKITQAQLVERLAELGFELNRDAVIQIESGRRRVTLDEALAIAAVLGVAPVNLVVPLENPERLLRDEGSVYEPTALLAVGNLRLFPWEARAWIRGTEIYGNAPVDLWHRYYVTEVPPGYRRRLDELAEAVQRFKGATGHFKLPKQPPLQEEKVLEMPVPGYPMLEGRQTFPAPLWTYLMFERPQQEED